jgi:ABC-type lipoprotein export system ATPase subunit
MIQHLNQKEGITVIMVTHDAAVARHAGRLIHVHDGVIVDGAFGDYRGLSASKAECDLASEKEREAK